MNGVWQLVSEGVEPLLSHIPTLSLTGLSKVPSAEGGFWVIDARDRVQAGKLLEGIRSHYRPNVYLRPVVYLTEHGRADESHNLEADACVAIADFHDKTIRQLSERFHHIQKWIRQIPDLDSARDTNIAFKVLRHLASRDMALKPLATALHPSGFIYPTISHYFGSNREGAHQILAFLEKQRLITGSFHAKAHFCTHCDCAYLNFQEICPDCSSANLTIDELVHHFKCAYTAPLSDFKTERGLVCVKCDRELKHIGVDYDKPSIVYGCNDCGQSFQDPETTSTCYGCGRSTAPENQELRTIQSYKLSSIGENAARYGMENLFTHLLEEELGLVPFETFKTFIQVEGARIDRYQVSESSLLIVAIRDLDELYLSVGSRASEVFGELSAVFKSVLRRSDIITARNETLFLIMLAETSREQAERALDRLQQGVTQLLEVNLNHTPRFAATIEQISGKTEPEQALERLLSEHDT